MGGLSVSQSIPQTHPESTQRCFGADSGHAARRCVVGSACVFGCGGRGTSGVHIPGCGWKRRGSRVSCLGPTLLVGALSGVYSEKFRWVSSSGAPVMSPFRESFRLCVAINYNPLRWSNINTNIYVCACDLYIYVVTYIYACDCFLFSSARSIRLSVLRCSLPQPHASSGL